LQIVECRVKVNFNSQTNPLLHTRLSNFVQKRKKKKIANQNYFTVPSALNMFANTQSLKNRRKYQQRSDLAWSEKPTGLFFFVGWGKKGEGD
jgi:hypothetical protein